MNTLSVCRICGISYATFTIVDIDCDDTVRIMEDDNPPYILIRRQTMVKPVKNMRLIALRNKRTVPTREAVLQSSVYTARAGDRLFPEGVTQSGMGCLCAETCA